jgi:hypothetical protein
MISCHEGTSSQTIFSAQTQLHFVLGQQKRYTMTTGTPAFGNISHAANLDL